jgi:hypothetical protein
MMNYKMRLSLRRLMFGLGGHVPQSAVTRLDNALNHVATGSWVRARGFTSVPVFKDREELFELIARDVSSHRTLYLEFGVYRGESMKVLSSLLKNPDSLLHGFDSFQGLPVPWTPDKPRGHFSTGGVMPQIEDPRVRFFKGWFSETLPRYHFPEYDRLVINLDADLYSGRVLGACGSVQDRLTTSSCV